MNDYKKHKTSSAELNRLEHKLHQLVNQHRKSIGLLPFKLNHVISARAREHSQAMAEQRRSSGHIGRKQRTSASEDSSPHTVISENIAYYQGKSVSMEIILQFWLKSERHRNNINGTGKITGIGIAKTSNDSYFITQLFCK